MEGKGGVLAGGGCGGKRVGRDGVGDIVEEWWGWIVRREHRGVGSEGVGEGE